MDSDDSRKIWLNNHESGKLSLKRLYAMAMEGQIDHTTHFWSEKKQDWLPLSAILFDLDDKDHLAEFADLGITHTQIIGAGHKDECPACAALVNEFFLVTEAPIIPPKGCSCIPWCRLMYIAMMEEDIPRRKRRKKP